MFRFSFWGNILRQEKKDICVGIWEDDFEQREQIMVKMRNGKLGTFEAGKAGQCNWR